MDTKRRERRALLLAALLAAWALAAVLRPAAVLLAIATASRGCQIRRSQESRVTNNREGRRRGGVQSKRPQACCMRLGGRPGCVQRALMLLAAGLPSCKELWALSSWAVGAGIWARGCQYRKIIY